MSDTVKIPRPKFTRKGDSGGRVEHDERGNARWVRTRSTDAPGIDVDPEWSIEGERPARQNRKAGDVSSTHRDSTAPNTSTPKTSRSNKRQV